MPGAGDGFSSISNTYTASRGRIVTLQKIRVLLEERVINTSVLNNWIILKDSKIHIFSICWIETKNMEYLPQINFSYLENINLAELGIWKKFHQNLQEFRRKVFVFSCCFSSIWRNISQSALKSSLFEYKKQPSQNFVDLTD